MVNHWEPLVNNEAISLPSGLWREAEEMELQLLNSYKTLLPSVLPPDQKLIYTKLIYAFKYSQKKILSRETPGWLLIKIFATSLVSTLSILDK